MPLLCGPKNSRYAPTGSAPPHLDLALRSDATCLGEAILEYEAHFNVKLTQLTGPLYDDPNNAGKFFEFKDLETGDLDHVDIHIFRGGQEICAKQDLSVALEADDVVEFGPLLC